MTNCAAVNAASRAMNPETEVIRDFAATASVVNDQESPP